MKINIFWFRRDLRLEDNIGLFHALQSEHPLLPIFIFDKEILDKLENKADARVQFIHDCLMEMQTKLVELGFTLYVLHTTPIEAFTTLIKKYEIVNVFCNTDYEPYARERDGAVQRNIPGVQGTSHLGLHLRFGTISIRRLAKYSRNYSETFLNELIWRDFYQMILWHFPHVGKGKAFKPAYDSIQWRDDEPSFKKWCDGQTGYPIVDAGMRELNETGFMHNRVRMIVASFLCKHLLIDWRLGEAYFAEKLLDFDLASNNGGWQWAAGSGCDAAPYFRIFNPYLQTKKFDPELTYIKKWVPEFEEFTYPKPIVEHTFARDRCLKVYKEGLAKAVEG